MGKKVNVHKVTLSSRRREKKRTSDLLQKGVSRKTVKNVFDTYYKDSVMSLYRAIFKNK